MKVLRQTAILKPADQFYEVSKKYTLFDDVLSRTFRIVITSFESLYHCTDTRYYY